MEQAIKLLQIDFGSFGIPGIDISFNDLSLPSIDLNLPSVDLNLPSPFPEISDLSIDFANAINFGDFDASFLVPRIGTIPGFEQFQPICASTDFTDNPKCQNKSGKFNIKNKTKKRNCDKWAKKGFCGNKLKKGSSKTVSDVCKKSCDTCSTASVDE